MEQQNLVFSSGSVLHVVPYSDLVAVARDEAQVRVTRKHVSALTLSFLRIEDAQRMEALLVEAVSVASTASPAVFVEFHENRFRIAAPNPDVALANGDSVRRKGFDNVGNTCWLAAALTLIERCRMAQAIVDGSSPEVKGLFQSLFGREDTAKHLRLLVDAPYLAEMCDSRNLADAQEAFTKLMEQSPVALLRWRELFGVEILSALRCSRCAFESEQSTHEDMLQLALRPATLQQLLDEVDEVEEKVERRCTRCQGNSSTRHERCAFSFFFFWFGMPCP